MNWKEKITNKSNKVWEKTSNIVNDAKDSITGANVDIIEKIRNWIVNLLVKAIQSCSTEQDRLEIISWLALVREILANPSLPVQSKLKDVYRLIDSKKTVKIMFHSVMKTVDNYKDSDLPLPVKIAIPTTLTAATIVGGQGAGLVAFGGAIGMPVLLLIFIGTAGITAIIEVFFSKSESRSYISIIMAIIAKDEILRRTILKDAMTSEPAEPKFFVIPDEELQKTLIKMEPYDFERHIMSFFQNNGMLAWVTKKSNDAGVDGFARHSNGLIIVQCKRYAPENSVGRPVVQQFKGVIEENEAWRGYIVTTSRFTNEAKESAAKNDKIFLINMDTLVKWHRNGFSIK
ncbi:restriction endonuclease [Thiotrichales bacterium HSG1]|nr:restriction endonuclease [Thiotrichales bacterium HSG1]